jgi:hypothetical protein
MSGSARMSFYSKLREQSFIIAIYDAFCDR